MQTGYGKILLRNYFGHGSSLTTCNRIRRPPCG